MGVRGMGMAEHTYTEPGTFTVRLRVTDATGLTAETTRSVTVGAPGG